MLLFLLPAGIRAIPQKPYSPTSTIHSAPHQHLSPQVLRHLLGDAPSICRSLLPHVGRWVGYAARVVGHQTGCDRPLPSRRVWTPSPKRVVTGWNQVRFWSCRAGDNAQSLPFIVWAPHSPTRIRETVCKHHTQHRDMSQSDGASGHRGTAHIGTFINIIGCQRLRWQAHPLPRRRPQAQVVDGRGGCSTTPHFLDDGRGRRSSTPDLVVENGGGVQIPQILS